MGPQGDMGPMGPSGPTGQTGPTGPQGPAGQPATLTHGAVNKSGTACSESGGGSSLGTAATDRLFLYTGNATNSDAGTAEYRVLLTLAGTPTTEMQRVTGTNPLIMSGQFRIPAGASASVSTSTQDVDGVCNSAGQGTSNGAFNVRWFLITLGAP
jgi:hypothetical protein